MRRSWSMVWLVVALGCVLAGCGRSSAPPAAALASAPTAVPAAPAPAPAPPEEWTLAVLPDTQYYSAKYPKYFEDECRWLAKNASAKNLKYVVHVGDITDSNGDKQWAVAKKCLGLLDGVVPLALVPGNHDYTGGGGALDRKTGLDKHFPPDAFKASASFGGLYDEKSLANSYHLFSAGGRDWLILCLEFGPRDEVVAWANGVLDKYPDRLVLVATHAYLSNAGPRLDQHGVKPGHGPHKYPMAKQPGGVNDGEELWQKLIRKHAGVALVVCGHVSGVARLTSKNDAGGEVHQMLSDYQSEKEGGEGYLRILHFSADGKTLDVRSYSPSLDKEKKVEANRFTLDLTKTALGAKRK
ncbi:MAG: metallophosphoesterase [Armatimonadetes bacterium]|nr:metallophosphoesterase [Armatimonadota bacterium]